MPILTFGLKFLTNSQSNFERCLRLEVRPATCCSVFSLIVIMLGFEATCDFPSAVYYKEQMEAYPNAKVILTKRDPEKW
jgi:hypothetical protein